MFNDSAAHIREFIKDAYSNWEAQYIVLGGDWDNDNPEKQIVATRMFLDYHSQQAGGYHPSKGRDKQYSETNARARL